jgi:hypothetical protein
MKIIENIEFELTQLEKENSENDKKDAQENSGKLKNFLKTLIPIKFCNTLDPTENKTLSNKKSSVFECNPLTI